MSYDRRGTYFAFQGLLTAVLLLLFVYHQRGVAPLTAAGPAGAAPSARLAFLALVMLGSLAFLRLAPESALAEDWVLMALFSGDAAMASLTLQWTNPSSDLYLIYFLILFGTALMRRLLPGLLVAAVTSLLYLLSAWGPARGLPSSTEFWLRLLFLWVTASLLAILSRDSSQAQWEAESLYQERLTQVESLATLGQVAGEVAHRIKGPLTTILVNAEVLSQRHVKSPAALRELKQIQEEVEHCKQILKNLLDLGRIEEMDLEALDLREPLRSALRAIGPQARRRGLRIELGPLGSPLMVRGDRSLLHEAIVAVLQNAVDASKKGGHLRISAGPAPRTLWRPRGTPAFHELSILDDGTGISPEDMRSVFKPFFTTKGQDGSGLGLSAALHILRKHGGEILLSSDGPGRGACATLRLPATPGA